MSGLKFREIKMRRTPGFPHGGPDLGFPSPDVTIVYGPNASGKTTTARALQALLWPGQHQDGPYSLHGRFEFEGAVWTVDLDAGLLRVQRDGKEAEHPVFAPAEAADRYLLGLHELALADNRRFAEAVLRESTGGYDLAQAAAQLDFEDRKPRKGAENNALELARHQVRQARERQENLRSQEAQLARLLEKREQARAAQGRVDEIKRAIALVEATERLVRAEIAVGEFPANSERLTGDEDRRLEELNRKISQEEQRRDAARTALEKARAAGAGTGLGEGGVNPAFLQGLVKQIEELDRQAAETSAREQELQRAMIQENAEFERLGPEVARESLLRLDLAGLGLLADFARQAEKLRGERKGHEAVKDWIGRDDAPRNLDVLREGLGLLNRWLADSGEAASLGLDRRLALVVAGMTLAGGVVLGYFQHWLFLSLSVVGVAVMVWAWGRAGRSQGRRQREADYKKLGLTPPVAWTIEAVEERVKDLQQRIIAGDLAQERVQRWGNLSEKRRNLEEEAARLQKRKSDLVEQFGVAPDLDEANLFWVVESLRRWQDARGQRQGAEAALAELRRQCALRLEALGRDLAPYGYRPPEDLNRAREAVEDLRRRGDEYRQARLEAENAEIRLAEAEERLAGLNGDRRDLFAALDLADGDEKGLAELLAQRPAYLVARKEFQDAVVQKKLAQAAAQGFEELAARPRGALEAELGEGQELAAALSEVSQRVGQITHGVEEARKAHDLEEALAREDDARNRLREARDRDCRAALGWALVRHLEKENRDLNLPKVFYRARTLFATITRGRYELDFDAQGPSFRTVDTSTGYGQDLDELSSATRLQLLLAVRMAFVEEQEQGPKLPLLLDETLANSDEERTQAIIRSAIEFCRAGRQVFYFTARHAEVAKWERLLKEDGRVGYSILDLATLRRFTEAERLPLVDVPPPARIEVPPPEGMSHLEYGRVLGVPGFNLREEEIGGVHLWHVIDDLDLLYRLLCLGINRWGQLQNLISYGGLHLLEGDRTALARAEASARVLKAVAASWRIGRGRKVDRAALLEGGVSDKFVDRVFEVAETLGGDAARLLEALEAGEVKGFRKNIREKLQTHLEQAGYLDEREHLPFDQIRVHALAAAAQDMKDGLMTAGRVEEMLARALPKEPPNLPLFPEE
ncbi:MAG: AAA family ATPase [Thermodesulfobacteriota bacterium]